MTVEKLHHVAYRCRDAVRTADFYTEALGLKFTMAMSDERAPTTGDHCQYIHIFFEMADGSHIAFFELPEAAPMKLDPNTPPWVQYIALEVSDASAFEAGIKRLKDYGVEVTGPLDHHIFQSIYFHDPDGYRVELTYRTERPGVIHRLRETAVPTLERWAKTRRVPNKTPWVHQSPHSAAPALSEVDRMYRIIFP